MVTPGPKMRRPGVGSPSRGDDTDVDAVAPSHPRCRGYARGGQVHRGTPSRCRDRDTPRLGSAEVEPHFTGRSHQAGQDVSAAWTTHHDAGSAVIDVTFGKGPGATAFPARQRRGGDIESQHFCEDARGRVTVDVRWFGHRSSLPGWLLAPNRSVRIAEGGYPCSISFAVTDSTNPVGPQT